MCVRVFESSCVRVSRVRVCGRVSLGVFVFGSVSRVFARLHVCLRVYLLTPNGGSAERKHHSTSFFAPLVLIKEGRLMRQPVKTPEHFRKPLVPMESRQLQAEIQIVKNLSLPDIHRALSQRYDVCHTGLSREQALRSCACRPKRRCATRSFVACCARGLYGSLVTSNDLYHRN